MPCCSVISCSEVGIHSFPKDLKLSKQWLKAIRRKKLVISNGTRLCRNHFVESDYVKQGKYSGLELEKKFLRKGAVPSIFPWTTKTEDVTARGERQRSRDCRKKLFANENSAIPGLSRELLQKVQVAAPSTDNLDINEVEVSIAEHQPSVTVLQTKEPTFKPQFSVAATQTEEPQSSILATQTSNILRFFSTELLQSDEQAVMYYTGLESYQKFNLVLQTLMPMANNLKYRWSRVLSLSVEDQFLILLIKLRCNRPDYEISKMFGISKTEVSNIFVTWVNFVHDMWSLIDSIMADRGFNVQDLFISKGIGVNIPTFLKGKSQIPGLLLKKDQEFARERVHIERLIGLTKTYKVLTSELNHFMYLWHRKSSLYVLCFVILRKV